MESYAQSTQDYLIDGLSYKMQNGASYVTNRRSISFYSSGSDTYSPSSGVKVIKLKMNGTDWLDGSTVKVQFDITNNHASESLTFLSGPHAFFRRMRVLCQGQVIEDLDSYNRVCEMFNLFQSTANRKNDAIEGARTWHDAGGPETLAYSKKRTMSMKLCSGLLNQSKMLPIRYAPIEVELEIVGDANEAVESATDAANWSISNVQLKADVVTLDNGLENSYAEHLLSGKSLPINYGTYINQDQVVSGNAFSVNISRSATRLKSVFISLLGASATSTIKEFNHFWHPMGVAPTNGDYDAGKEVEFQVQIGSKLYPEMPIRSSAESFSQLSKCLGIQNSPFHSLDISGTQYRSHSFIVGIDTEKVLQAGFTGINTKAGDLMTIKVKPVDATSYGTTNPTKIFTVLHTDNILEIRDGGVTVFD